MQEPIQGGKINIKKSFKKLAKQATDILTKPLIKQQPVLAVGHVFEKAGNYVDTTVKSVLFGINSYNQTSKTTIEKFGNIPITSLVIGRTPIPSAIQGALGIFTSISYDKLFHLFLLVNNEFTIEKNAVINIAHNVVGLKNEDLETSQVTTPIPQGLTLVEMLNKTQQQMGDRYFKYQAGNNNCQVFLLNVLKSNGLGDESNFNFIKQNTEQLFKNKPYLRKFANTVTDLGATFAQGQGIKSQHKEMKTPRSQYKLQTIVFSKKNWDKDRAKLWLEEHKFKHSKVDVEDDSLRFRQIVPEKLAKMGYDKYRTIPFSEEQGITAVIVYPNVVKQYIRDHKIDGGALATLSAVRPPNTVETIMSQTIPVKARKIKGSALPINSEAHHANTHTDLIKKVATVVADKVSKRMMKGSPEALAFGAKMKAAKAAKKAV